MNAFKRLHRIQLLRYIVAGGLSYGIEISCLFIFLNIFHFDPILSVGISFWVGFIVAYVMQKILTFQNTDRTKTIVAKQLGLYSLLVGWNYMFTILVVGTFKTIVSVVILRTIVIAMTTCWNYIVYKRIFNNGTMT
jgi:putative flippase GtrA